MKRRTFCASSLGLLAAPPLSALAQSGVEFPNAPGLTKYVADFIVNTKYDDIPQDVLALGRKSILDGFGLALSGSVSEMGPLVRRYIGTFTSSEGASTVIGNRM